MGWVDGGDLNEYWNKCIGQRSWSCPKALAQKQQRTGSQYEINNWRIMSQIVSPSLPTTSMSFPQPQC